MHFLLSSFRLLVLFFHSIFLHIQKICRNDTTKMKANVKKKKEKVEEFFFRLHWNFSQWEENNFFLVQLIFAAILKCSFVSFHFPCAQSQIFFCFIFFFLLFSSLPFFHNYQFIREWSTWERKNGRGEKKLNLNLCWLNLVRHYFGIKF